MEANNIRVDIITDKEPQDTEFIKSIPANIISPTDSLRYTEHTNIFMYGDSYCYERMANFRSAVIKAFTSNIYDAIICNTYESVQVVQTMGLSDCVQVIAYTHLESQMYEETNTPFLDSVNEMMRNQMRLSDITVGTQSTFNIKVFNQCKVVELPIPFPEKDLLKEYHKPREGVLFIGRWEEGKNPELFLDIIEQTKLPARVMTNSVGAKKFEDRLKKIGVDYKIAVSIIGKEKVDFITDCRMAVNPSTVESYGVAFWEQITQLPTIALTNQRWTNNFDNNYFFTSDKKNIAAETQKLYNQFETAESYYKTGALNNSIRMDESIASKWINCFNAFEIKKSNSNSAKICQENTIKYKDFIKNLGRNTLCIDDIRSVLSNKHKFRIIFSENDTFFTKDPNFVPVKESFGLSLFDGL